MAMWLVRAGGYGEHEQRFLVNNRIYLTWDGLKTNLSQVDSVEEVKAVMQQLYPDFSKMKMAVSAGQVWAFSKRLKVHDLVILPSKHKPAIHVGEIKGDYKFDASASDPYYHYRDVTWLATDIPRTNFDQDLLYSFGAFMAICEISRNDAENRVRAMQKQNWKAVGAGSQAMPEGENEPVDLALVARDQISAIVATRFKGHAMARLVDGILRAQGYATYVSPPGPDKGIDILAGQGPLGFERPRICVQVKSGDSPLDRPTLDQLIGAMQNFQADHGLLVSWGGFKSTVDKEEASQFFRVRLWDQDDLIDNLLANYDKLDADLLAELPLKRIWVVTSIDAETGE